ncbi:MAG: fimbria/pilus outer membrane usher protein [Dokdonella sp.]|uniref:fimbria/pilus outer membrane usher protein n=1 Tax=Dokdonella sp. TaxID=2291710 RepID=UPI003F82281B
MRSNALWRRSISARSALARCVTAAAFALGAPHGHAQTTDSGLIADDEAWVRGTSLYLDVTLNRVATGRLAHFDQRDGALWVRASTLRALGFAIDPAAADPLPLASLGDVVVEFDAERQRIALTAPLGRLSLATQTLNAQAFDAPHATSSPGAVLDYDLYATAGDGTRSVAATTDLRAFADRAGVFETTAITRGARVDGGGWRGDSARLDTSWQLAFPASMLRLRIGDTVTDALDWTRATRIGGISIGTDFGLQPYRVTTPLPAFFGSATLPSAVDLYVDGVRQYSGQVAPGPFQLNTVPVINGAGSAQLVVTDALGRASTVDLSLYASRQLLARGLADWSVDVGYVRRNYGITSFDYGSDLLGIGSLRYGVSDRFTLEAHGEHAPGLALGGVGGVWLLGSRGGVVSASVARSDAHGDGAGQVTLGYSWADRRFAFSFDSARAQKGYRDAASAYGPAPPRATDRATFSVATAHAGSLGVNYLRQAYTGEPTARYAGMFWSDTFGGALSLNIGINHNLERARDRSVFASVTWSLASRRSVSASLQHRQDSDGVAVQASQPVPGDGGFGWRLLGEGGDGGSHGGAAEASWLGNRGAASIGVSALGDSHYGYGGASGAFALIGGHVFASRAIDDAFAVVSTDGVAGVPVQLENRTIGQTDDDGLLLVARLNAYQHNRLSIDPMQLPANMQVERVSADATPADRAGTFVRFGMKQSRAAQVALVDAKGAPLALGSRVRIEGREGDAALVGFDGVVYLEGLERSQRARVDGPAGACVVRIDVPDSNDAITQLGPLRCVEEKP